MRPRTPSLAPAAMILAAAALSGVSRALVPSPPSRCAVRQCHRRRHVLPRPSWSSGHRKTALTTSLLSAATITEQVDAVATASREDLAEERKKKELGGAFADRLSELEEYKRQHGHCLVPKRYAANPTLGNWVNKQRQNYRRLLNGEKTSMNETRIAALNDIGFVWDATAVPPRSNHSDVAWRKMYNQLLEFREENGHCRVPSSSPLGQWVVRQRFLYRQHPAGLPKSSFSGERIHLLNEINFPWSTRSEQLWEERISDLRQFKKENGHCMVPRKYNANPALSAWVATQRKNYNRRRNGKTSPLTVARIEELEELGFVWSYWEEVSWEVFDVQSSTDKVVANPR